jgi:hypothetical protein
MNHSKIAEKIFGKTEPGCCVICKNKVTPFKNELSAKEYEISGMCQSCQDDIFESGEDNE